MLHKSLGRGTTSNTEPQTMPTNSTAATVMGRGSSTVITAAVVVVALATLLLVAITVVIVVIRHVTGRRKQAVLIRDRTASPG